MRENQIDFALDGPDPHIEALLRCETLLAPGALEDFASHCFNLVAVHPRLSVDHLRLALQAEDHFEWLLRSDLPRLQLWHAEGRNDELHTFCRSVADLWQAIGGCLGRYALSADEWATNQDLRVGLLPLTIAVAMLCHVHELRWRARAGQTCALPLKALHRIYRVAEEHGVADHAMAPYESDVEFTITPSGQYVLMLLMTDLAERELPPVQRLVAQHWLARWSEQVRISAQLIPGVHGMQVDLDSDEGIARIAPLARAGTRYLDIRPIARSIEETDAWLANSHEGEAIDAELVHPDEADLATTLGWLEKLYHDRSAAYQPARNRKAAEPEVFARVISGWNPIQDFMDASTWDARQAQGSFPRNRPAARSAEAPAGFEYSQTSGTENERQRLDAEGFPLWRLLDTSPGGLGLGSGEVQDAELPVGALLLVQTPAQEGWSLGRVMRKFRSLDTDEFRFGVQLLGVQAAPVRLTARSAEDQVRTAHLGPVNALMLSSAIEPGKRNLLLLPNAAFTATRRFEMKSGTARVPIFARMPVQSAGAWVLARVEEGAETVRLVQSEVEA